ncbi:MAG: MlaD family protein [bacterium]
MGRHTISVGIAIVLGVALAFYAVYFVSKKPLRKADVYEFSVVFKNIQGLGIDADVRLAGVIIGKVKGLSLRPDGKAVITVAVDKRVKIPRGSRFTVQAGFLQDKTLDIDPPEKKVYLKYVRPGEKIEDTVSPASLDDLAQEARVALKQINQLLASFNEIVSDENLKTNIYETISNLNKTTREAYQFAEILKKTGVANRENIDATLTNVREFSEKLNKTVESVDTLVNNADKIIGDETVRQQLKDTIATLKETIENIRKVSETLADLAEDDQVKNDIRDTIHETRLMVEDARSAVGSFNRMIEAINKTELSPDFQFRYSGRDDIYSADMNLRIFPPESDVYYLFGLDDIGEHSKTNLMLGVPGPHPDYWYRFGLKRAKLGIGFEWKRGSYLYQGDLIDPNDMTLNLRVGKKVNENIYFMLGIEGITKKDSLNIGIYQGY